MREHEALDESGRPLTRNACISRHCSGENSAWLRPRRAPRPCAAAWLEHSPPPPPRCRKRPRHRFARRRSGRADLRSSPNAAICTALDSADSADRNNVRAWAPTAATARAHGGAPGGWHFPASFCRMGPRNSPCLSHAVLVEIGTRRADAVTGAPLSTRACAIGMAVAGPGMARRPSSAMHGDPPRVWNARPACQVHDYNTSHRLPGVEALPMRGPSRLRIRPLPKPRKLPRSLGSAVKRGEERESQARARPSWRMRLADLPPQRSCEPSTDATVERHGRAAPAQRISRGAREGRGCQRGLSHDTRGNEAGGPAKAGGVPFGSREWRSARAAPLASRNLCVRRAHPVCRFATARYSERCACCSGLEFP